MLFSLNLRLCVVIWDFKHYMRVVNNREEEDEEDESKTENCKNGKLKEEK